MFSDMTDEETVEYVSKLTDEQVAAKIQKLKHIIDIMDRSIKVLTNQKSAIRDAKDELYERYKLTEAQCLDLQGELQHCEIGREESINFLSDVLKRTL